MTELWIGPDGVALEREPLPRGAEVWDMYGPVNTRYVYLVENGRPAAYPERSLPWIENPAAYHQFLVVGDCVHIRAAYERSGDALPRRDLDDLADIGYYRWDTPIFLGTVAPAFGDPGGATQIQLPLPLSFYLRLGLVRELTVPGGADMNRGTLLADLRARGHTGYSLFEDPRGKPNVVVLTSGRGGFETWIQDERAQPISGSFRTFAEEPEALADFAHRVEIWNRVSGVRSTV